jgi:hypothetical protein
MKLRDAIQALSYGDLLRDCYFSTSEDDAL